MKIAILGWGSLLWDDCRPEFAKQVQNWISDGPNLKIEFSRVSKQRDGALTLVLDAENGQACQVAYALSRRKKPDDAICDLRNAEKTTLANVGFYFADHSRRQVRDENVLRIIEEWASEKQIDVVIWTDLESNFQKSSNTKSSFSIEAAIGHILALKGNGKVEAVKYVWRAPVFVRTPLREALEREPWFRQRRRIGRYGLGPIIAGLATYILYGIGTTVLFHALTSIAAWILYACGAVMMFAFLVRLGGGLPTPSDPGHVSNFPTYYELGGMAALWPISLPIVVILGPRKLRKIILR